MGLRRSIMNSITGFAMPLMVCFCATAASEGSEKVPPVPKAFVRDLVKAINARDLNAVRKLTHPATLKCMTPDKDDYYTWWIWKDGSKAYRIPAEYAPRLQKPIDVTKIEATMKAASLVSLHWPLQPDYELKIRYHSAPKSIIERTFEITLHDGKAQLALDCPTKLGIEMFHQKMVLTRAQKRKLEKLWQQASAEDRKTLEGMAKNGRKLDGMDLAQKKYRLNQDDAIAFIDMVQYADTP